MKRFDIEKQFTEMVSAYLMEGWVINSKSMSGHQGEEVKIDLVKDNELVRIWISKEMNRDWLKPGAWSNNIMYLRIGRWNRPASDSSKYDWTVWMNDIDVFGEKKFYEVSNENGGWYVEDLDEALNIQKKRQANWSKHYRSYEEELVSDRAKEIATKYLKNKVGYKRISYDKLLIKKSFSNDRNHAAYYVIYNGNSYRVY